MSTDAAAPHGRRRGHVATNGAAGSQVSALVREESRSSPSSSTTLQARQPSTASGERGHRAAGSGTLASTHLHPEPSDRASPGASVPEEAGFVLGGRRSGKMLHMTDAGTSLARMLPGSRTTVRFFSSASDARRSRRPTDAVLFAGCALTVGLVTVASATSSLAGSITAVVQALPGLVGWFWELCDTLVVVWALVIVGVTVCSTGRLSLFRDQALAVVLAIGAGALVLEDGVTVASGLTAGGPATIYPALRLALSVAILATSSPHLGRPIRRVGRWLIVLASFSAVALGISTVLGVIAGLALGGGAAAIVHLLFGSPGGVPTIDTVRTALAEMGVPVADHDDRGARAARRRTAARDRRRRTRPDRQGVRPRRARRPTRERPVGLPLVSG